MASRSVFGESNLFKKSLVVGRMLLIALAIIAVTAAVSPPAHAAADTAPPVLSQFDFTPKTVDVAGGSTTVTVTTRVTDATGAEAPTMLISSDATTQSEGFGTMTRVSGTATDGVYQRTVTIPATAAPGTWTVKIYPLQDTLGNSDGTFHSHPTKLTVTNGPAATAPTAPAAPTRVSATRGDQSAHVSWVAPAASGSPITGYTITSSPGGVTKTVPGDQTDGTITGLTNGTAYTFTVAATNTAGTSPASAPSAAVTPATKPSRVAKPTVKVKGRKAIVKWAAPSDDGGSPIAGYRVVVNGKARTTGADARKLVLKRLKSGRYKVKVAAVNAVGAGPTSGVTKIRIRAS